MAFSSRYLPRTPSDMCASLFSLFVIHAILLFELLVILPYIYEDSENAVGRYVHIMIALYIYLNVIINYGLTIVTDTTSGGVILPAILKPGWRFCSVCECNAPPRSYHCDICRKCILRRDHHCVFTGNCIGHTNQRYYMMLVFYMCVAGVYANIMNFDFTYTKLGGFSVKSVFTIILPLFSWVLGFADNMSLMVAFMCALCIFGTLLMMALFTYHILSIYRGQTTYENTNNVREYDIGWKGNIRTALGKNWHLVWIFPLIPSPLFGNGIEFKTKNTFEETKDM